MVLLASMSVCVCLCGRVLAHLCPRSGPTHKIQKYRTTCRSLVVITMRRRLSTSHGRHFPAATNVQSNYYYYFFGSEKVLVCVCVCVQVCFVYFYVFVVLRWHFVCAGMWKCFVKSDEALNILCYSVGTIAMCCVSYIRTFPSRLRVCVMRTMMRLSRKNLLDFTGYYFMHFSLGKKSPSNSIIARQQQ